MSIVRSLGDGTLVRFASVALWLAAAPASAQVARLLPVGTVEVVDPSERISGTAAAGIVLGADDDPIGIDRLWAYISPPAAEKLKLRISSIDGRYYAEVDYSPTSPQAGWVALDLELSEFAFLEKNYDEPMSEIAALLSDGDSPRFYPVRWGPPHGRADAAAPKPPNATDELRIYMNTERAQAFVVVDGAPDYCRDASAVSGFKFNAICDVKLGDLALPAADGKNVVEGIEVLRRSGVRTLAPLAVDVRIAY